MSDIRIGDLINHKYRIESVLGEGGMGTVYRAKEIGLDRMVAMKVPKPAVLSNKDFMARFSREAKLVAKLNHDNIVQVFEFYNHPDLTFMALEFVRGEELGTMTKRPPKDLTVGDVVEIMKRSCDGIAHAHEHGVVHRDIKPANILVSLSRKNHYRVKVMDFGIAHVGEGELFTQQLTELTQAGSAMGTPSYMSPEQVEGAKVTNVSDIYSIGCVMFNAFTLRNVFEGSLFTIISQHVNSEPPNACDINPNLPPAFNDVIQKSLAKSADDRHQNARDLGDELADALQGHYDKLFHEFLPPGMLDDYEPVEMLPAATMTPSVGDMEADGDAETLVRIFDDGDTHEPPPPTITSIGQAGSEDPTRAVTNAQIAGAQTMAFGEGATAVLPEGALAPGGVTQAGMTQGAPMPGSTMTLPPGHVPQGTAQGGGAKWVIILLVLAAVGGGVFFVMSQQGAPLKAFEEQIATGNLLQATNLVTALDEEQAEAAYETLNEAADKEYRNLLAAFQRKAVDSQQILDGMALEQALADVGYGNTRRLENLEKIDRAISEMKSYEASYETFSRSSALREADVQRLEAQKDEILALVAGLVDEEEFARPFDRQLKGLRELAKRSSAAAGVVTPTPTPTPIPKNEIERKFNELKEERVDPTIAISQKIRAWEDFADEFPKFSKIAEVNQTIAELEREQVITPEIVLIQRDLRFSMGSREGVGRDDERPQHIVELSPYGISKHEVSAEAFSLFLTDVGKAKAAEYFTEGGEAATIELLRDSYVPKAGAEKYPANYVTWDGAVAYAEWVSDQTGRNFSLPTEAQWERAAAGPTGSREYPMGDDINSSRARYDQVLPTSPPYFEVMRPVNSMPDGRSEEGIHHMAGNVAEWVRDYYDRSYKDGFQKNPTGPEMGRQRVVRGGGWETFEIEDLRVRTRERKNPDQGYAAVGFRLVEIW